VATRTFADRLAAAVVDRRSQLVVGLDPQLDLLPLELRGDAHTGREAAANAYLRFCRGLSDAVCPYVVAVKPQTAFFEALGSEGMRSFEDVCEYARAAGLLVIADAKRGDIGSTARAYASAYLEPRNGDPPLADAMTANTYLGRDSLEPLVKACRRHGGGLFCLVKTSNPGGVHVQDLKLTDGTVVWHQVAKLVAELAEDSVGECGLSSIGAVVGATFPRAVTEARRLLPQSVLLLPGVGAQGATPADVARAFTSGPASALVTVSRSVIYAFRVEGAEWRTAAAAEAARLRDEVWRASGW
jgi:orotidine-5'-phosphate decarboxylase